MLFPQNSNNRLQDFFFWSKIGCAKNSKKLRLAQSKRNSLLKGRTHQLVIQYQGVRGENIRTSNIVQTENNTFKNIYAYTYAYMCVTKIPEKRVYDFERDQGKV